MNLAGLEASLRSNLPGVALGGLVLLLGAISFWRSDALAVAEKQLAQKQVLANRLGRNVKQAAQLPAQTAALSAARQALDARILRGGEIGPHAEFFYRLEREAGVKLTELRPQPALPPPKGAAPRVIPVPFTLSVQGSWPQLLEFLELLESDDRYVRVQTMSIVANPANRQEALSTTLAVELAGRL
jgi:hypothetical protein